MNRRPSLRKTTSDRCVIHVLWNGFPLCGFSRLHPQHWPEGHIWTRPSKAEIATCPKCQRIASELVAEKEELLRLREKSS